MQHGSDKTADENPSNSARHTAKEKHTFKFWLDMGAAIGGVVQIAIGIILIFTLMAYYKSNETTRESLEITRAQLMAAQVPWIGIKISEVKLVDNSWILVASKLTNYGGGPAISLNYDISLEGLEDQFDRKPISRDAFLAPNDYQRATARFIKGNTVDIYKKIMDGDVVIREIITFRDVFGRTFSATYKIQWDPLSATFDVTSNEVSGYDFERGAKQ
jgi:hypothetical protein